MKIIDSRSLQPTEIDLGILKIIDSISVDFLMETVNKIAIPRHYIAESSNNRYVRDLILERLRSFGYAVFRQGVHDNIVAYPKSPPGDRPVILIGAHYDSVPFSAGADDNASAVAALLACAGTLSRQDRPHSVCFAAFNREEEDLKGSRDFVHNWIAKQKMRIAEAHIFEMVGFCDQSGQKVPSGLPIRLPEKGDFLGVLANRRSNHLLDPLLTLAATYLSGFQVLGLKVYMGAERVFPVLKRSDHVPFWGAGIPALMWTDTAEFRNPNYHKPSDTPDTLDYNFLRNVTRLALLRILTSAKEM